LTDNGSIFAAYRTLEIAAALNLEPYFKPVESNGMAEAFANQAFTFGSTFRWVNFYDIGYSRPTKLGSLPSCILAREPCRKIFSWVGKDGDSRPDPLCMGPPLQGLLRAIGVKRYDNDVSNPKS
jgi:hypothetical protein